MLAAALGAAVLRARPEPLAEVLVLAAVLDRKAAYQERLLGERFGAAYDEYRRRVPRRLPLADREASAGRTG